MYNPKVKRPWSKQGLWVGLLSLNNSKNGFSVGISCCQNKACSIPFLNSVKYWYFSAGCQTQLLHASNRPEKCLRNTYMLVTFRSLRLKAVKTFENICFCFQIRNQFSRKLIIHDFQISIYNYLARQLRHQNLVPFQTWGGDNNIAFAFQSSIFPSNLRNSLSGILFWYVYQNNRMHTFFIG